MKDKHIVLGVTGSIAAYKSADLARRLRDAGASVRVVMTESAQRFITPMTMQAVSGNPVHAALFDLAAEAAMGHIELARWADLILIAPATAECMAKLAHGHADDLLTTLCLATRAPVAIAPAMNQAMWQHTLTQQNLQQLQQHGIYVLGPGDGSQACGDVGLGRMLEPADIVSEASKLFQSDVLAGLRVLITAGPTHEAIDPVRYVTNGSSGKMGYALAQAAQAAGATVKLVSGPVHLVPPAYVDCEQVMTAEEMHAAVMQQVHEYDIFLAVAAVSDYRSEEVAVQKLHKNSDVIERRFVRNPDIAASVGALVNKPFIVGFAAETESVIASANAKRQRKNMDMIVANQVSVGMGGEQNAVTVITPEAQVALPLNSKTNLARELVAMIAAEYHAQPFNKVIGN